MERRLRFFVLLLCTAMTLSSCGGRKEAPANPLLSEWDTPYGVPPFDRIVPADFPPAFDRAMSLHNAEIEAIASDGDEPTFDNTMLAYDRAGLRLGRLRLLFDMLSASDATPEMQSVRERMIADMIIKEIRSRLHFLASVSDDPSTHTFWSAAITFPARFSTSIPPARSASPSCR